MTYLLVRAVAGEEGGEIIFNHGDLKSTDFVLFIVALSTSIITSSLCLAKNLRVGPCRILAEQKENLGGLLSPRFILIFFVCSLTLVSKGLALAFMFVDHHRIGLVQGAVMTLSSIFLPGFFVGLFSCCRHTLHLCLKLKGLL